MKKNLGAIEKGRKSGAEKPGAVLRVAALVLQAVLFFGAETLKASFEPLPVGGRAAGMADAYTVVADDALSLFYNPAGLMHVRRPEVTTHYSRLFAGLDDKSEISRSFLGYAQPLPKNWGAVGVSYVSLGLSSLYSESTWGLSYAKEVKGEWNLGGTLKLLRKSFGSDLYTASAINVDSGATLGAKDPVFSQGQSKSAMALDLGAQYRLKKNYALGLALRNINQPDMALGSGAQDKVPAVYALGGGRWTRVSSLSLELSSWKFADGQDNRLSVGGERWFRGGLGMRAGLALGSRDYRNLALGGSYRMDGFQFDYALNYPLQGIEKTAGTHMVSLTFRFGKPAPDPIEAQLKAERDARLKAEAEMARLRQQLMELTAEGAAAPVNTEAVDSAAQDALRQAEEEIRRLKSQVPPPAPVQTAAAAPAPAVVPKPAAPAPVAPAKPRIAPELLSQFSESLAFYSQQTKAGVPVEERAATLERILEKYGQTGIDTSAVRAELKKIKAEGSKTADAKVTEDYQLAVSYYRRLVQQGTKSEERILLLERIVKKYKPLGVNTADLEKELESLKEKK